MDVSANFDFLKQEFPFVAESASMAEQHIHSDPRSSCFRARHALESLVKRLYKVDKSLTPPRTQNLDNYLSNPEFKQLVPHQVLEKSEYIRKTGNVAVHGKSAPDPETALHVVKELFHVVRWAGRTYLRKGADQLQGRTYDESVVPQGKGGTAATKEQLETLKTQLDRKEEEAKETETELQQLRAELAAIKAENDRVPDHHDWNEDETRRRLIDVELLRAGWKLDRPENREYEVKGMPNGPGVGYADYVLWGDDGKPLAVIEAKKTTVQPEVGQEQARLYANCLEEMHGQRPIIFYTNGFDTRIWDDHEYPPRKVSGFYKKSELETLIRRREMKKDLQATPINEDIAGRYYQKRAIRNIGEHFSNHHRKSLLVMATGSGKTRTAIALSDVLQRANWVKRVLFLADRKALVRQAVNAFKQHLPDSSPVNLLTEKDAEGRVYVSTYPTMMGLIDESDGDQARFGPGHFDLIIIDEAHRSVYQKFGAIFRYFDAMLVGLTATPREQVDRNTYSLFGLEPGIPTDAYELEQAVTDGFLVPPQAQKVDLRFPTDGIDYDDLSDDEKALWDETEWDDSGTIPDRVDAAAINSWLFNEDTVDKMLKHLMENGHKVDGGDRLAKTIIFARNHDHAAFIQDRFDHHYPHLKGVFARVIDYQTKYVHALIEDFEKKDSAPHIAISVDMLDTGVDIPEVANLVFFKPVYSKIKFWQMIGRGTRLCPDLFGPDDHKKNFRVFDFCRNFERFKENPDGVEVGPTLSLGTNIFRCRADLIRLCTHNPDLDPEGVLKSTWSSVLQQEVQSMSSDNFIVREKQQHLIPFQSDEKWQQLTDEDIDVLKTHLSDLPSSQPYEEIETRRFDLIALRMQLALAEGDLGRLENRRNRVTELARRLESKAAVPAVREQLIYLAEIQVPEFWDGCTMAMLEDMRVRLRGLMQFLDKGEKKIVHTNFEDDIVNVEEIDGGFPKMTGEAYERHVNEFLRDHNNHIAIGRLRQNEPLTPSDLESLEKKLVEIGEEDGERLLSSLLDRKESESLAHFVRSLVGLDRNVVAAAFSTFISDRNLRPNQIRFVEMLIDQLTSKGVMSDAALYEAPFTTIHAEGPDALFNGRDDVLEAIFTTVKDFQPSLANG